MISRTSCKRWASPRWICLKEVRFIQCFLKDHHTWRRLMSRSYKHRKCAVVHFKQQNSKIGKRQASVTVRKAADVPNGKQYKKYYCSWNISDYAWLVKKYTRDEFRRKWFDTSHFHPDSGTHDDFAFYRTKFRNWKEAYRFYIRYHRTK